MPSLADQIRLLIEKDQWGLTWHANESIQQRQIEIWQVIGLSLEGRVLRETREARPRPKVEIEIVLPDGTSAKTVWAYDAHLERALLITVHFYDNHDHE